MLSGDEDLEINALKKRGWSISAIARHVGHDRKTVRGYLNGERTVGVRERAEPDPFDAIDVKRPGFRRGSGVWVSAGQAVVV